MWSNLELMWDVRAIAHMYARLGSFARLITFDPRGGGLSDRGVGTEPLEERMEDLTVVLDACESDRAALVGYAAAGPIAELFAATHPERTTALILLGTCAKLHPEWYAFGRRNWKLEEILDDIETGWGGPLFLESLAPSLAGHPAARKAWARYLRLTESPSSALAQIRVSLEVDLTPALPSIQAPTLVIHREGDRAVDVEHGRELAAMIPNAVYKELPGSDNFWWVGDVDVIADEIQEFLTGVRPAREPDRILATVLFTDLVGSTERAAELGDRGWNELLERHNRVVRRELAAFRGREVSTAGDSFMATFDGPARGIRCAQSISQAVERLGLQIRAGLHTGEVERVAGDIRGIAVHIGARVAAIAAPGEVLVSAAVPPLVAGSGLEFEDRGSHALKGVPGEWHLYGVTSAT
jgi:class 3 adenylate cyclase/pimeloyl-ACP methyl ester carboxylesterase